MIKLHATWYEIEHNYVKTLKLFPHYLAFMMGIHRLPVDSPHTSLGMEVGVIGDTTGFTCHHGNALQYELAVVIIAEWRLPCVSYLTHRGLRAKFKKFCRQQFDLHFPETKLSYFDSNSTSVCSKVIGNVLECTYIWDMWESIRDGWIYITPIWSW